MQFKIQLLCCIYVYGLLFTQKHMYKYKTLSLPGFCKTKTVFYPSDIQNVSWNLSLAFVVMENKINPAQKHTCCLVATLKQTLNSETIKSHLPAMQHNSSLKEASGSVIAPAPCVSQAIDLSGLNVDLFIHFTSRWLLLTSVKKKNWYNTTFEQCVQISWFNNDQVVGYCLRLSMIQ